MSVLQAYVDILIICSLTCQTIAMPKKQIKQIQRYCLLCLAKRLPKIGAVNLNPEIRKAQAFMIYKKVHAHKKKRKKKVKHKRKNLILPPNPEPSWRYCVIFLPRFCNSSCTMCSTRNRFYKLILQQVDLFWVFCTLLGPIS